MTNRQAELEKRLRNALEPEELLIKDQSHLHAGHAGAQDGRSHFAVRLTASAFEGLSRIQRHRLVYDAAGDMMDTDIHALSISALAPGES
ncbi:BolA family protein [Lentisalinibacter salinarum]|uniref:BolA family protein n=1 Tax=Lentisalinibacter salinarum TaxID=2992239 RepID=UPI003863BA3E